MHEVFLKLGGQSFASKTEFMKAAATAVRRILVDHARASVTDKRGGGAQRIEMHNLAESSSEDQVLAINVALERLAKSKPEHAQLVEMRFFGGMTGDGRPHVALRTGVVPGRIATVGRGSI